MGGGRGGEGREGGRKAKGKGGECDVILTVPLYFALYSQLLFLQLDYLS